MAERTDLHSILVSYSNKNNSPYVSVNSFLEYLEYHARTLSGENPEWLEWITDKAAKFWAEMNLLLEMGKCEMLADSAGSKVYVPDFFPQRIESSYATADEDASIPFHNEESLGITLPESRVRPLSCDYDLFAYLAAPQSSNIPILRLSFPDGFGSALVLASMIPRRLTELALLKIRRYLRVGGNKEYVLRKLLPQLQGRESNLRDQFNRILIRPLDCYNDIKDGGEFSNLFWAHFCVMLKADIKRKKEFHDEDIAAIQSAYILDTINGYYKSLALKRRDMDLAFRSLENHLSKPPFLYTMDQICKFTSAKGVLLLSQYSSGDLQEWIRKKTTESEKGALPGLLIIRSEGDERAFALKEKIPVLCLRFLVHGREHIKIALTKHWRKLIMDYMTEPAMKNDDDFERALQAYTRKVTPVLAALLEDPKLALIYDEVEQGGSNIPISVQIFKNGKLLPYSALLLLRRRELLRDIKLMLPIWYSFPIISSIIAFFKGRSVGKSGSRYSFAETENAAEDVPKEKDNSGEIRAAAQKIEGVIVPAGYSLESYMEELELRWSQRLDKKVRDNLIEDVKSLIRDYVRRNVRKSRIRLTRESVGKMAQTILSNTPSLTPISSRDSLLMYTELYLIKLLRGIK